MKYTIYYFSGIKGYSIERHCREVNQIMKAQCESISLEPNTFFIAYGVMWLGRDKDVIYNREQDTIRTTCFTIEEEK